LKAFHQALKFCRDVSARTRYNGATRLPTIHSMAHDARVAVRTMQRAVKQLEETGVLEVRQKAGIHLVEARTRSQHVNQKRRSRWRTIGALLGKEIESGLYRETNQLPSATQLVDRFDTCYETIRKACQMLERKGIVISRRRRYFIRNTSSFSGSPQSVVKVIVRGTPTRELLQANPHAQMFFHALEQESRRSGVGLEFIRCNRFGQTIDNLRIKAYTKSAVGSDRIVLGFIVWTASILEEAVEEIIDGLMVWNKPVAILDEYPLHSTTPARRCFRITIDTVPGEVVGAYCLKNGITSVAYIDPFSGEPWSIGRYRGLCRAMGNRGHVQRILCDTPPTDHAELVNTSYELEKAVRPLVALQCRCIHDTTYEQLVHVFHRILHTDSLLHTLEPVITTLLHENPFHAWVGASDPVTCAILDVFRRHQVSPQHAPRLIGFDDSRDAAMHGLTSYNFNGPGIMRALLDFILQARTPGQTTEIRGYVTERFKCGLL